MAEVYHNNIIDIDLESGTLFRSFLNHTIGSGDNNANWYGVRVFRKGQPIALSGCSVQGLFMPASGSAILISDGTHTWVSGNEAAVLLPQACYNVKGQFTLTIKIIGTNSYSITDTVRIIDGVVADTYSENPVAPTAAVPTYQEILAVYDQMVAVKEGCVLFNSAQSLTAAQMTQARGNIAAASESDVSDLKSAIKYDTAQRQKYNGEPYFFAKDVSSIGYIYFDVYPIIPSGSKIIVRNIGSTNTTASLLASDDTAQNLSSVQAGGVIAVANFDVYRLRCYQNSTGHFAIKIQILDEFGRIDSAINSVRNENIFDPNADYYVTNTGGIPRNAGYTVQKDGTVITTGNIATEQLLLTDPNKKIYPGEYELSGHVTFASGVPTKKRKVCIRLLDAAYQIVNIKTERGGSTDIGNSDLTGYFYGKFSVAAENIFRIEFIGDSNDMVNTNLPLTIDQVIVKKISEDENIAKALKNFQIIPLNGGYPKISGNNKQNIVFNWGSSNVYVIENGKERTTVTFEQIRAAIPDYATIEGTKLTIAMPENGVFGFDVKGNTFVMLTNYDVPATVKPLYYRYYGVCFGELQDRDETDNIAINNNLRMVYTTASARHTIDVNASSGAIVIHVGSRLNVRMQGWSVGLDWNDISSDISENIVIDGLKADITVPSNCSLVLNTTDQLLHLRLLTSGDYKNTDDIVLLQNAWAVPIRGFLYDEYINRKVEDGASSTDAEIVKNTFNSGYHIGAQEFANKCEEFSAYLLGTVEEGHTAPVHFESFLFFTDPHLTEGNGWEARCHEFVSQIQKYYNSTPTTFCLCGGDWLGNSDLPTQASFKLGYIDGFMHSKFNDCYLLVGNHDTNYQGKKDAESATYTTKLSNQSIADLWYRKSEKAYYVINGVHTNIYCFDTGTENQSMGQYDDYGWEQAQWFANALLTDNSDHIAMAAHIIYYAYDSENPATGIQPLTAEVLKIAQAFNSRTSIEVNGTTYNYTGKNGKAEFFIGGHYHQDMNGVLNGIPYVLTTWVRAGSSSEATFDLVVADYDNRKLHMVRVGQGDSRTIDLS